MPSPGGPPRYTPICRDPFERERLLDVHRRLTPANGWIFAILGLLVLPAAGRVPAAALIVLGVTAAGTMAVSAVLPRLRRPELAYLAAMLAMAVAVSIGVTVADAVASGGIVLITWTLVGFNARFRTRVAAVASVVTALIVLRTQLSLGAAALVDDPLLVTVPLAVLISVAVVTSTSRIASHEHHREAVLDRLTGLLNRTALESRVAELTQQAPTLGTDVALVLADIDHFKDVNDGHGHAVGDAVLADVGAVLRRELRAFDLTYRVGGEEFAVLLPGADGPAATALAERLAAAIRDGGLAGLPVTVSFGVAVARAGAFAWDDLYRRADAALYRAKADGRDRVCGEADGATAAPA